MNVETVTVHFRRVAIDPEGRVDLPLDNVGAFAVDDGPRVALVLYIPPEKRIPVEGAQLTGAQALGLVCPEQEVPRGAIWGLGEVSGSGPQLGAAVPLSHIERTTFRFDGHVYPCAHSAVGSVAATVSGGGEVGTMPPGGDYPVEAEPGTAPPGAHAGECTHGKWDYPPFMSNTILHLPRQ